MSEPKKKLSLKSKLIALVAIILFSAIATPSFIQARRGAQANKCIGNMIQISAAKSQWALDHHAKPGDIVTENDIKPYVKLDSNGNLPKCPAGGKYSLGVVIPFVPLVPQNFPFTNGQYKDVTCSLGTNIIPAHVLP